MIFLSKRFTEVTKVKIRADLGAHPTPTVVAEYLKDM